MILDAEKIAIIEYWKKSIAVCCNALFYGVLIHVGWTRQGACQVNCLGQTIFLLKCFLGVWRFSLVWLMVFYPLATRSIVCKEWFKGWGKTA